MFRIRLLAACAAAALVPAMLAGCPGPAAAALGTVLDQLEGQVEQAAGSVAAEASGVVTQTAAQLDELIDKARISFESALGTAVDKIDQTTHDRLDQIQAMVDEFTSNAAEKAAGLLMQAQTLALTLPLANGQPKVTTWTPHFVTGRKTVLVSIAGIFTEAQLAGRTPQLTVGNSAAVLQPAADPTLQLVFAVPGTAFGAPAPDAVLPVTATLTVPYRSPVLHRDQTGTFKLLFGLLPPTAGTVRLTHIVHTTTVDRLPERSPNYHQQGKEDGTQPDNGDVLNTYCTDPITKLGWTIVPFQNGETLFHLDASAGDESNPNDPRKENKAWSKKLLNAGDTSKQCVQVWTRSYSNRHSGDISFHLEWTLQADRDVRTWVTDTPLTLQWGEQRVLPVVPGEWKITYQPFEGAPIEADSSVHSQWVTVTPAPKSVTVAVADGVRF
jgi:hypothetical protein